MPNHLIAKRLGYANQSSASPSALSASIRDQASTSASLAAKTNAK